MKRFFKWLGRTWTVLLLVCCCLLVLSGVCFGLFRWTRTAALSQQAADWWQGGAEEGRFAQVSAFMNKEAGFTLEQMMQLRRTIDTKLLENSIQAKENARLTIDAYSSRTTLNVSTDRGSAQVTATGVGGDFFFFHPYQMMSGQYLQPDELLQDLVLIDWDLAWRLYGASDVVGFPITVGGMPCYVGGVFRRDEQWPEKETYGETPRLYLSYDLLERINPGTSISTIEVVLPNPVSGFGRGILENGLSVNGDNLLVVENSARYGLFNLVKGLQNFGTGRIQTTAIILPYWENAARLAEAWAQLFLVLTLVSVFFPLVVAIILIVKGWNRKAIFARWIVTTVTPGIKRVFRRLKKLKLPKIKK